MIDDSTVAMLVNLGESLHRGLIAPLSPIQRAMRLVMSRPRPGDLVLVTMVRSGTEAGDRFGRYLCDDVVVDDETGKAIDTAHVIVGHDGRVLRWVNCDIVRVSDVETAARAMLDARPKLAEVWLWA